MIHLKYNFPGIACSNLHQARVNNNRRIFARPISNFRNFQAEI